ncbi:Zn-ribbon domain-containing OB-fold protein [Pigmentiphaga sp. H8]|uniref:Zn-ribbon domain-containing OB-fold protein n=1 Tax=Pigmentiphaga sp. H8 TaxID=2488560 RepID=UPI001376133B|nr:OB-fold domain-containing protein [Pigmentiphaga sp. H8]
MVGNETFEGDTEEAAAALKTREGAAREMLERHKAVWGDGPPYFSTASFRFWQEIDKGSFYLCRCSACEHVYFPPRVVCPECWAQDAGELHGTQARGVLKSFTDLHVTSPALKPLAPLRLAVVDLEEGVRVLTWLRGNGAEAAKVGDRCRIVVEDVLDRKWFVANIGQ